MVNGGPCRFHSVPATNWIQRLKQYLVSGSSGFEAMESPVKLRVPRCQLSAKFVQRRCPVVTHNKSTPRTRSVVNRHHILDTNKGKKKLVKEWVTRRYENDGIYDSLDTFQAKNRKMTT